MVSFRGQESWNHAQTGFLQGFNSKFLKSILAPNEIQFLNPVFFVPNQTPFHCNEVLLLPNLMRKHSLCSLRVLIFPSLRGSGTCEQLKECLPRRLAITFSDETRRWHSLPQVTTLGTFSIHKGDGSENATFKMNWRFFQLCRVYFSSLKIANVG